MVISPEGIMGGSGGQAIANMLYEKMKNNSQPVQTLDGDNVAKLMAAFATSKAADTDAAYKQNEIDQQNREWQQQQQGLSGITDPQAKAQYQLGDKTGGATTLATLLQEKKQDEDTVPIERLTSSIQQKIHDGQGAHEAQMSAMYEMSKDKNWSQAFARATDNHPDVVNSILDHGLQMNINGEVEHVAPVLNDAAESISNMAGDPKMKALLHNGQISNQVVQTAIQNSIQKYVKNNPGEDPKQVQNILNRVMNISDSTGKKPYSMLEVLKATTDMIGTMSTAAYQDAMPGIHKYAADTSLEGDKYRADKELEAAQGRKEITPADRYKGQLSIIRAGMMGSNNTTEGLDLPNADGTTTRVMSKGTNKASGMSLDDAMKQEEAAWNSVNTKANNLSSEVSQTNREAQDKIDKVNAIIAKNKNVNANINPLLGQHTPESGGMFKQATDFMNNLFGGGGNATQAKLRQLRAKKLLE